MTLRTDRTTRGAPAAPLQRLPYGSLGMDAESLKRGILTHLEYTLAELPQHVDSARGRGTTTRALVLITRFAFDEGAARVREQRGQEGRRPRRAVLDQADGPRHRPHVPREHAG